LDALDQYFWPITEFIEVTTYFLYFWKKPLCCGGRGKTKKPKGPESQKNLILVIMAYLANQVKAGKLYEGHSVSQVSSHGYFCILSREMEIFHIWDVYRFV
jgi:hypothetical protein